MKKLIFPIFFSIFFLLFLLFPVTINAQSSSDCWPTHMIRQYATCSPPHTACLQNCSRLDTTPKRKVCFEECGRINKLCTDKAVADYRVCVKGGTQTLELKEENQTQPSQEPVPTAQQKTILPVQDLKDDKGDKLLFKFPVFLNEWFNLVGEWIKLNTLEISLKESEWREEQKEIEELKKKQEEARARLETLEANWERQAREAFWKSVAEAQFVAGPGDQSEVYKQPAAEYKKGGNDEFEPLLPAQILSHGDVIQVTRRTIIRTPNYVIEVYPRGIYEKAVIELRGGKLMLKSGVATVWKGGVGAKFVRDQYGFGIRTPVLDTVDVQTQYTVAHDEKENKSYVIVSEGEVKITTKDGKTAAIAPDDNNPGIAVVSQKISPVKLGVIGLVLVVVIAGGALFLKRKFAVKEYSKKKK